MSFRIQSVAVLAALAVSACGSDDDHNNHNNHGGETPEEEACEHMERGPAEAVTATQDMADAPSIGAAHTRFDVRLFEDTDASRGFVTLPVSGIDEYEIYQNNDTTIAVTDANGAAVEVETSSGASEICPDLVKKSSVFDLGVGTYTIEFGPTSNGAVSVVVEASNHSD